MPLHCLCLRTHYILLIVLGSIFKNLETKLQFFSSCFESVLNRKASNAPRFSICITLKSMYGNLRSIAWHRKASYTTGFQIVLNRKAFNTSGFSICIKSKSILYKCFSSCIRSKSILYNWFSSCIKSKSILYILIFTPEHHCIKCVIFGSGPSVNQIASVLWLFIDMILTHT